MTFSIRVAVREDDLDVNGHVRAPIYLVFSGHASWAWAGAAGVSTDRLREAALGPVNLETTVRFRRELRAGDEVDVSCVNTWGEGPTSTMHQELTLPDGTPVAEVTTVGGLIDLRTRRLVTDLTGRWRSVADSPHLLGL